MIEFTLKREGTKFNPAPIAVREIGPEIPFDPDPFINFLVDRMIADQKAEKINTETIKHIKPTPDSTDKPLEQGF